MLEEAKVTLSLSDFDELREKERELERLERQIANCVELRVYRDPADPLSMSMLPKVSAKYDTTILKSLALEFTKKYVKTSIAQKVFEHYTIREILAENQNSDQPTGLK